MGTTCFEVIGFYFCRGGVGGMEVFGDQAGVVAFTALQRY